MLRKRMTQIPSPPLFYIVKSLWNQRARPL